MASFNRVQMIGNLGKQAELRYLDTGKPLMEFSIAVQNGYGDKAKTDWWDVKMWGERAEKVVQYLEKGTSVFIDGRLEKRSWEKDGVTQYRTDIVAQDIVLLGGGKPRDAEGSANRTSTPARSAPRQAPRQQTPPFGEDEELPF